MSFRRSWWYVLIILVAGATRADATGSCSITNVVGVAFGTYDVFSTTPDDTAGSVSFLCSGLGSGTVTVSLSAGSSSSMLARTLVDGASTLGYNVYLDAARSIVWGDGTNGTSTYGPTMPPDGTEVTVTAYGRVPAEQNVAAGTYADTLVVTLTF